MDNNQIYTHIDHTQLKAVTQWSDIKTLCEEAINYGTASICVPPSYVSRIHETYGESINICTVIGFPLGYNTTEVKLAELKRAMADGAQEFDMVVNLGDVKNGNFDLVTDEIRILKKAAGDKVLKVIIETCYLTTDEKIQLCKCVTEGKADYIKTSTGFGTYGAKIEDIELFKKYIGADVRIKAAGGIKSREDLEMFLNAGCERIGTSSAIAILNHEEAGSY